MKITIETKQTEVIEIATPAYFKGEYGYGVYYLNDDVVIKVMELAIFAYRNSESNFANEAEKVSKLPPTTAEHFKSKFDNALNNFKEFNIK
jgi:hypothetical protein